MSDMTLYSYWRSSAAYRVRIALALKGLNPEQVPVNLLTGLKGEALERFRALNPQQLVPTLVVDEQPINQSTAIIEYLEETHPEPPLLPGNPIERARVRALCQLIACDMHPLNNLRVMNYLRAEFGADDDRVQVWYAHWIAEGFAAFEALLRDGDPYCAGETVTMADLFLVPQFANAERFACDVAPYPRIAGVVERLRALAAFQAAAPEVQPDAML